MPTHLFAIGGGGYCGPQGGASRLLLEILRTTGKKFPKVCLIPTATGDKPETIHAFVEAFNHMGAHPNYLSLYHLPTKDLEDWVLDFDAIYTAGGNTKNLLALWKAWRLDTLLLQAWRRGVVISGASTGAICRFEQCSSDFIPGEFNPFEGLGTLKGSCCPHFEPASARRASYLEMVQDGRLRPGYGVPDRAALHYVDGELAETPIEPDAAGVYRVEPGPAGTPRETRLPSRTV